MNRKEFSKLKLGDKVTIIGSGDMIDQIRHHFDIGTIITIDGIDYDDYYVSGYDSDSMRQYVSCEDIKLVEE